MSKVKRVATIAFGQGVNVLVNFLFLPYMARALNYEDYGTYGQVLLITAFVLALLSSGLPNIIYVYLANDSGKERSYDSNLMMAVLMGVLGSIGLSVFSDQIGAYLENDKLSTLLRIFSWSIPLQIAYNITVSRFIFEKKVKHIVALNIGANLLKIALVIISIQLFSSLTLTFWSILFSHFVQFLTSFFLAKKQNSFQFDLKLGVAQLKDGFPLGIAGLLGTGIIYIDGLMVSKLIGVKEYAIYRNGAIEIPFISTIYTSVAAILLPEISTMFKKGQFKEIIDLKRKSITSTSSITYPIMFFLLFNAEEIITTYLGLAYKDSAIIFSVFNLTLLMRVTSYQDVLISANKSSTILIYNLAVFVMNLLLNIILIDYLGMIGAAISTVICLMVYAVALLQRNMKELHSNLLDAIHLKSWLLTIIISLILAILVKALFYQIDHAILRMILSAVVFFPITYWLLIKKNILPFDLIKKLLPTGS